MNIADLILALQHGQNPNAAIMAAAQAPDGGFPPAQPPGVDAAPVVPPAPPAAAGPPIPTPRPRPAVAPPGAVEPPPPATPAAPEGVKTPVTNPMPAEAAPRIIQSPPDLSNMYMELIKKNQNAAALDSGASLIAAGFSKYPEIRTGLIHGAFNKTGQHQLTSEDIVRLQTLQIKNQQLAVRQAAKASLGKKYNLSRDTLDYLDASDKLDEVLKAHETQALQQVTNAETGQVSLHHGITGKEIAKVGGPKDQRTEDAKALDAVNAGRVAAGQPPIDMETFITTVKRDQPQQPNATDIAALDQINRERVAAGQPPTTMEDYIKTVKRDPRQAANEADVLALAAINKERPADKQMTMEHYLTKVKRQGQTINVGPQGQPFGTAKPGFTWLYNEDGTVMVDPVTHLPKQVPIAEISESETKSAGAKAAKDTREEIEAQEKKNKAAWAKIATTSNTLNATYRALELVNKPGVTGTLAPASRALSFIGGKPSDSYDEQVRTIDANTALAELKSMRESSQTGASGLGSVTDFEQRMLASTINSLRANQQSADAEKGLIRVAAMFKTFNENRFDEKVDPSSRAKFQELLDRNIHEITIEHTMKNKTGTRAPSNIRRID